MVRHIVSWNFKPELSEEQRREIGAKAVAAIDGLTGQIPCLVDIKAHCPPLDGSTAQLVLYSEVERVEDLPRYQNHPAHQAILPLIRDHFCDRHCCDIED